MHGSRSLDFHLVRFACLKSPQHFASKNMMHNEQM